MGDGYDAVSGPPKVEYDVVVDSISVREHFADLPVCDLNPFTARCQPDPFVGEPGEFTIWGSAIRSSSVKRWRSSGWTEGGGGVGSASMMGTIASIIATRTRD